MVFVYLIGGGTDPQMTAEDRQWLKDTFITPRLEVLSFLEPEDFREANGLHTMTMGEFGSVCQLFVLVSWISVE
jgi:hypothetical protein